VSESQRPLEAVPPWVALFLAAFLGLQIFLSARLAPSPRKAGDLPTPPRVAALRIAAIGEPAALARLAMVYLQSFDYHGSNSLPFRRLDYDRLVGWLKAIHALDPLSKYPVFAAAHVYAEVHDPVRQRKMLDFIYSVFLENPNRHWPALAHASLVAKHRLKDLDLSLKYARAIDRMTTATDVPLWARQMQVFILEDMNELEAASIMLGGLLAKGQVRDAAERQYLERRLKALEERSVATGKAK
jgi:hypothetical protein